MDGFSKINQLDDDEYYYSEEGYIVFTEKYLLKRGYCCQNGCKHCPYGFKKNEGRITQDKKMKTTSMLDFKTQIQLSLIHI